MYLLLINLITFAVYGIDKHKARKGKWRISESTLLLLAVVGGSIGAWAGMKVWHHKTLHKKFKYGVPTILALQILLPLTIIIGGSFYLLDYSLNPSGKEERDQQIVANMMHDYPETFAFIQSAQKADILRDTFIVNDKGIRLHAKYVSCPNAQGTAILVHGYTDNLWSMMMFGEMYYNKLHFNILLPEHQRHGESGGDRIQMGWLDRLNIERWIDVACQKWPTQPIYLHGVSMGAATVMMCSGDALPPSVKGIIEDCGYTSVWDEFSGEIHNQFGLPVHPLLDASSLLCDLRYGWNFHEASAIDQIAKSTLPVLFIHGDADTFVPTEMVYRLYEAKRTGHKELWITPGTTHARSYHDHPAQYLRKVKNFIQTIAKLSPLGD